MVHVRFAGSWPAGGLEKLTVKSDVSLAFAFLPVCTLLKVVRTRTCGCGKDAASEHRDDCGFGEHGED
jgi:hypothetical protein